MLQPRFHDRVVSVLHRGEDGHRRFASSSGRHEAARAARRQHQAGDAIGVKQGEVERHAAAERMADQVRAIDLQVIEQSQQVVGNVVCLFRCDDSPNGRMS